MAKARVAGTDALYDVLVDLIFPYLNFVVLEGDFFTLSVFALRGEEQVGLFAMV
jgi:hypothetical protein